MRYALALVSLLVNFTYAQCDYSNESQCSSNSSCEWVDNIETEYCSDFNSWDCGYVNDECWWSLCHGGSYGSWSGCCMGGTYQTDNSYCQEIEILECSDMNQLQCNQDTGCEWVEDIEIGNCSCLGESACYSNPECNFDCEMWSSSWCNGCCWGNC